MEIVVFIVVLALLGALVIFVKRIHAANAREKNQPTTTRRSDCTCESEPTELCAAHDTTILW